MGCESGISPKCDDTNDIRLSDDRTVCAECAQFILPEPRPPQRDMPYDPLQAAGNPPKGMTYGGYSHP